MFVYCAQVDLRSHPDLPYKYDIAQKMSLHLLY